MAPDCSSQWNDSKDKESASLSNSTIHDRLDGQCKHKNGCITRCANQTQGLIHGNLTTVQPRNSTWSVLEAEKEQEDADQGDGGHINENEKSNSEMANTHAEVTSNK